MIGYTVNEYQDIGPKPCGNNYLVKSRLCRGSIRLQSANFSAKLVMFGCESYQATADRFSVNHGQFLLAVPGEDLKLNVASTAQGCCFYFDPGYIRRLISEFSSPDIEGAGGNIPYLGSIRLPYQSSSFGLAIRAVAQNKLDADIHLLSMSLAETLVNLAQLKQRLYCQRPATQRELLTRLELAKSFILDAKYQQITLGDIESAACLSRFHLTRLFAKVYGAPPLRFHQNIKLDIARTQIAAGVPLKQVAEELGFSTVSAFSRAYQRRHNSRPSMHRPAGPG